MSKKSFVLFVMFDIFYFPLFFLFSVFFYFLAGWPVSENWKDALAGWRAAPKRITKQKKQ